MSLTLRWRREDRVDLRWRRSFIAARTAWRRSASSARLLLVGGIVWAAYKLNAGSFTTGVSMARDQPVPFSHKHHVGDDGIDCRYCHHSVETLGFRGTAAHRDLHELPFADLDQRGDA